MDDENEKDEPKVQADNNSIAVGGIQVGGNVGDIRIGHTKVYRYESEEDVPLISDEIENGLTRFAGYLPERAPILEERFSSIAKKLRATLGADSKSLSPKLKTQREDTVNEMKLISMEVLDISFRALCQGQNPPPYDSRPPFLGLFAFRPEDKEFYFGREALIQKLVARIKGYPFLAVLGASGSGKSSLVMAGLIPALNAKMAYFTPSSVPLYQHHAAQENVEKDTVFVVDQFEELFTLTHDLHEREQFVSELIALTKKNRVVITMRADFWGEVATYKDLKQIMLEHQELIAPMDIDELHSAMEKQAAAVGLRFDETLSESILEDVKGEPGAMPLLQHALWMLWKRRHGLYLKAEEYQNFGGVKQAIASTAEDVYASCTDFEQERVRDIFLRLTRLDESNEKRDTRRRALIQELTPANSDPSATIRLLNKLADARLIVKTGKDVEVAHEALIRHWSRLIGWLHEDRENLRLREDVSEAAREWDASGRDESLLNHRGPRLELALAMSKLPRYQLNPVEQAYLDMCVAARDRERSARESLRRRIWAGLLAGIFIAVVLAGFSVYQMLKVQNQADISLAGQLAAQAQSVNARQTSKQMLAALLSIQSMKIFPTDGAANFLLNDIFLAQPIARMTHEDFVSSVAFSPDGKYVVSGSNDNTARVWEAATGKEIARMTHEDSVSSVAFSPDGKYVVSGGDFAARVWEAATGQEIARMTHEDGVSSVAFSPDGKFVVSGSYDGTARVWEATTGKEITRITYDTSISSVAFSPDGNYIVSGGYLEGDEDSYSINHYFARVWEATTGKEIASMDHEDFISAVAFSPDGKYVASGAFTVRVWETTTGKEIASMDHETSVSSVAFSPDGKYIVSGGDFTARVWEAVTGQEIARMNHEAGVSSVAFSPDGKYIASGSTDNTVRVWEAVTGQEIARMTHDSAVTAVAFSLEGKFVVSGSLDNTARVWKATTGKEIARMNHEHEMNSIAFSPDGKYVVSGGCYSPYSGSGCMQYSARVWEAATGKEIARMTHDSAVNSVAFSPDGKFVVSGSNDGTARVWEAVTGQEIARMTHDSAVTSVAFSPDGKYVVSGSRDKTARVWEASTGKEIAHMIHEDHVSSVAFSPDGKYVVSGSWDKTARVWEAATGKEIARMTHEDSVSSVAFSPDGKYVVSGSRVWEAATGKEIARMTSDAGVSAVAFSSDGKYVVSGGCDKLDANGSCMQGSARVWEAATGKEIARMTHEDGVALVAFSPDDRYVVSGGCDTMHINYSCLRDSVLVWFWQVNDLVTDICTMMPRNLTYAEWKQYIGNAMPYPIKQKDATCPNLPIEAEVTSTPNP